MSSLPHRPNGRLEQDPGQPVSTIKADPARQPRILHRRQFLRQTAATLGSLALPGLVSARSRDSRPNLLVIMTDQQAGETLGGTDRRWLSAPAMEGLAAAGTRFDQAYCAWPVCVPSRAVMMSGQSATALGAYHSRGRNFPRSRDFPLFGQLLRQAGYDCGYAGKWHVGGVGVEETARHGFEILHQHRYGEPVDPPLPALSRAFLERPRDRPFFHVASFVNPHDICQWGRDEPLPNGPLDRAPPPADLCPPLRPNHRPTPDEPRAIDLIRTVPLAAPAQAFSPERWRQYLWAYYRLVEKVDAQIGLVLESLRRTGQAENTVVLFLSDHGDGMGAHRCVLKCTFYEESWRVPLVLSGPGVRSGQVDGRHLVNAGLDLLPTLLDYAGVEAPQGLPGRSLRPLAEGRPPAAWRDHLVGETSLEGVPGRACLTATHKYACFADYRLDEEMRSTPWDNGPTGEQLFDRRADPGETLNLALRPESQPILQAHRRLLREWAGAASASTGHGRPGPAPGN